MTIQPIPSKSAAYFELDDGGVVYVPHTEEIFGLNSSACFVWEQLYRNADPQTVVATLAEGLGFGIEAAQDSFEAIIDEFRGLGLLAGYERDPVERSREGEMSDENHAGLPPYYESRSTVIRKYRLLRSSVRVRFADAEQLAWVHPVLAHLTDPNPQRPVVRSIDLAVNGTRMLVYVDERPRYALGAIRELAPTVKSIVWQTAVNTSSFALDIHAGVVGNGEWCVLFPAPAGSGKSLLTAAMCAAGHQFFSDEVALLQRGSFEVSPTPLAMCFKEAGWQWAQQLFPEVSMLRTHLRMDNKQVRYLPPTSVVNADPERAYPVRHIVFPCYRSSAATVLRPLGSVEGFRRLMNECLVVPQHLSIQEVGALVSWFETLTCHELIHGSSDEAVALVGPLLERAGASEPAPLSKRTLADRIPSAPEQSILSDSRE